ncbi:MAG: M17 family metallopeptidase [Chromatiales bacterium]
MIENIGLTQRNAMPGIRQTDAIGNWIIVLPAEPPVSAWKSLPYGTVLRQRLAQRPRHVTDGAPVVLDLPNARGSRVGLAMVKPDIEEFELLTLARRLVAVHTDLQPREAGVCVCGLGDASERVAEAVIAALLAAAAPMPDLRSKPPRRRPLRTIHLFGSAPAHRFRRTFIEIECNSLARALAALPPTELTPGIYRRKLAALAREHGLKMEFYNVAALKRRKAGAFLAVAQGSPVADAGIARLRYVPPRARRQPPVALVGKGICFDTGGVNVKPAKFMLGMQGDMQGSAVALGTLLALARLKVDFPVEAWLALAMNHLGPAAYKPTDVVTAANGTTIEVIHTDAEGRMVLSDTLALCAKTKPRLIIDYATLTGACVHAIGKAYSGVFTNRKQWWAKLIEAGRESGERVWPFPLDKDYDKALESKIADIKQCAEEGPVDHILAARFLSRFVADDIPWIHLDLSSASNREGLAHVPTHFNGFGVRLALHLLLDQRLQQSG